MKIEIDFKVPMVPNFVLSNCTGAERPLTVDIADLTNSQLKQIGAEWTAALIKNAEKRRLVKDTK